MRIKTIWGFVLLPGLLIRLMNKKISSLFDYLCWFFIIAGVFVRFIFLTVSYEYDEIFTAITANPGLPLQWIWANWLMTDVHPPLHNVFLWVYNHFVPYGAEFWLRLPSLAFGLGAWWLGWRLFPLRFGRMARKLFAVMLGCSFYVVLYSQHARAYALMLVFSIPFTFLFLEMSRRIYKGHTVTGRMWVQFAALSLLLCWSHYFGALLFGVASLILFAQALYFRRKLLWFIAVPCAVFAGFLPWLVPNFLYNFSQARFAGNWWANAMPWYMVLPGLAAFFFNYYYVASIFGVLVTLGLGFYFVGKRGSRLPHRRDMALLVLLVFCVLGLAGILSLKMYVMFGRYFIEILPAVYLLGVLWLAPAVRKTVWAKTLFVLFAAASFGLVAYNWRVVTYTDYFAARVAAEVYREYAPEKELFVIALEAFPPNSLEAMYAYYPNQIYGMNARVTELYHLDETARDEALKRRKNAFIWMPNCNVEKLARLAKEWNRGVGVERIVSTSCFLQLTDKERAENPEWNEARYQFTFF